MTILEDELGDIISKARRGIGYSTHELARATGLTKRDIERIEAHEVKPDDAHLRALAESLSLDPEKLGPIANGTWQPDAKLPQNEEVVVAAVSVPIGSYSENCYILACVRTHKAAVVDPGGIGHNILDRARELGLCVEMVLVTHSHSDHTGGIREIVESIPGITVFSHPSERSSADIPETAGWQNSEDVVDIRLGFLEIPAMHTAGHTLGSTCFYTDPVCFVGDTLFAGSIGRPSSADMYVPMLRSIREKVLSLPDHTVLCPGHGPATSVSEENLRNPFF